MGRYAFSAWMFERQSGKDVAEIIGTRSKEWERGTPSERQRRIYVCLLDGGREAIFSGPSLFGVGNC
jgi:hypothetical protein